MGRDDMGGVIASFNRKAILPPSREREELTCQIREHIIRRAISEDDVHKFTQLVRYLSVDSFFKTGETLLCFTIKQGRWSLVQILLQKGAKIDLPDATGSKPLQTAILTENIAMVRLLVENGADLLRADLSGHNPLQLACSKGHRHISEVLLKAGADPNLVNNNRDKKTPLITAAAAGNDECLDALLLGGADPNAKDMWGFTAISKATINNHMSCVQVLLKHGASPSIGNRSGATPLQYSAMRNHCAILKVLLGAGASVKKHSRDIPPLSAAVLNACTECAANLLAAGADMTEADKQRKVPLYNALADPTKVEHLFKDYPLTQNEDRVDCVRLLLDAGADVQAVWKSHFYDLRHRSTRQLASYKLLIQATAIPKLSSSLSRSFFQKLAVLGCADTILMFCSTGYMPCDQELAHIMSWTSQDVCSFCLEMHACSLGETCHKISSKDFILAIKQMRSTPPSLKQLCRVQVRSVLHKNVLHMSSKLAVSDDLKKFITLDGPNEYMRLVS